MTRLLGALGCLLLAVVLGGGSGWATGPSLLFTIASMQALWGVGACLTGAVVGGRSWRRGAVAGGLFGLVAMVGYYVAVTLDFGWYIARMRLIDHGGEFWITAAVIGGALMGANGVVFTRWPTGRLLDPSAMAHAVVAGVLGCEALFVLVQLDRFAYWQQLREVGIGLVALAAVIGVRALLRSGLRSTVIAFGIAAACAPAAAGLFFVIEHRYGYVTV